MTTNPWDVSDASVFLKYCCPECDYQCAHLDNFGEHAQTNHDLSRYSIFWTFRGFLGGFLERSVRELNGHWRAAPAAPSDALFPAPRGRAGDAILQRKIARHPP